jgi:hypothetical protein
MTLLDKSQFPITVWPGTPLPPVLVLRRALLYHDATPTVGDDGRIVWRGKKKPKELPDEWVLRQLADADLDNDNDLGLLLEDYGVITWPYFDRASIPPDRREFLAPYPEGDDSSAFDWWEGRDDATLEDARWWLKTARALTRVWAEASAGRDPTSAWTAEGFPPVDEQACWAQFTLALDTGLKPFRARVEYHVSPHGFEFTYGRLMIGLYSAACCQVFNFIAGKETARRCENETCGRTFVHQLGGAKYGQHRSKGLLRFCTPACAQAQTQRQYRRRKAAQKKEKKP